MKFITGKMPTDGGGLRLWRTTRNSQNSNSGQSSVLSHHYNTGQILKHVISPGQIAAVEVICCHSISRRLDISLSVYFSDLECDGSYHLKSPHSLTHSYFAFSSRLSPSLA